MAAETTADTTDLASFYDTHLDRVLALSDGVYAIALTLLTIDLRLPDEAAAFAGHELFSSLLDTWPKLLGYITSFTVIGIYWIAHHRLYHLIRRVDGPFLGITLLHLATIAFLPFPTAVLGQHVGDAVAQEFYYGSLLLASLVGIAFWWYASARRRLVAPTLSDEVIRYYRVLSLAASGFFLLMMALIAAGLGKLFNPLILGYVLGFIFAALTLIGEERQSGRARAEEAADAAEALSDVS